MTDDDGASRRRYNRPRRYPVQAPAAAADDPATAPPPADITRQNPTLAEAAQQYGRRHTDVPAPSGPPPIAYPPGYPAPAGYPPGPTGDRPPPSGSRTVSTRTLILIGAAVLVVALVVGLIVGLSGDDDPTTPAGGGLPTPSTSASSSIAATPIPSTPPAVPSSSTAAGDGTAPSAVQVCTTLGSTQPVNGFVALPRPAERMPASYVEPQSGVKVAVCVGLFRPGAGSGRGRVAYLAEYERLAATQYALTLKTLGWTLVPNLPRTTYRNTLDTTVTLVQQGTTLVTVVGTGR